MSTKLSAEIIHGVVGDERSTFFYVRSIARTVSLLKGIRGDAWAAYRETPVKVGEEWLVRSERVSDAPRETIEQAVEDMEAAVALALDSGELTRAQRVNDKSPLA
jgi:hypothetical protein